MPSTIGSLQWKWLIVIARKKRKSQSCKSNNPNKRYRATEQYNFTPCYILYWIGILIYNGKLGTSKSTHNFWISTPYGIYTLRLKYNDKGFIKRT